MNSNYFKSIEMTPKEILAGDSVEIVIKLVFDEDFNAAGSRIILDLPAYLGYSRASFFDQEDNGYTEILCSNPDIIYSERMWDMEILDFPTMQKTSFKGMAQRMLVVDFKEGQANPGDELLIKWGYTRDGFGIGTKVTTLAITKDFYNTIHIRYFKDGTQGLPDLGRDFKGYVRPRPDVEMPVSYRILPREPERIRVVRQKDKTAVLVQDRFSNVCQVQDLKEYINEELDCRVNSYGVFEIYNTSAEVTSRELPLKETPLMSEVYKDYNIYFGDLHTHSSVSNDCIEREKLGITPAGMYRYGKEVARLDFMAVTDHHQPWDIERNKIGEENWNTIKAAAEELNKEGEFITFPGFEFRCNRGDTAVIVNENLEYNRMDIPEIKDIRDLWNHFKGIDYITIPHFHNLGGLGEGEWFECPYEGVETVLEIYSCHGSYERKDALEKHISEIKGSRQDRYGEYFLKEGYKYGFVCNSDGHKGHPGVNGLTAVYAKELTRDAVLEAIRKRRVYGTTNARIKLLFTINNELMGSVMTDCSSKKIKISLTGEQPFKAVDLIKDGEIYKRFKPNSISFDTELEVKETGPSSWYVRVVQVDNHLAYSSPIWFE
jgi:hypothetical protein